VLLNNLSDEHRLQLVLRRIPAMLIELLFLIELNELGPQPLEGRAPPLLEIAIVPVSDVDILFIRIIFVDWFSGTLYLVFELDFEQEVLDELVEFPTRLESHDHLDHVIFLSMQVGLSIFRRAQLT
jgi:hypothetical protein